MLGTYINMVTVLIGSCLGLALRKYITDNSRSIIYISIGSVSLLLGLSMALQSSNVIYIAISLIIGGLIGSFLQLENRIMNFGQIFWRICKRIRPQWEPSGESRQFMLAFLDSSILFCSGTLALLGSIEAGILQNYDLLIMKSVLDGVVAVMLAAAMGLGVAFSIMTILLYQGSITITASFFQSVINDVILQDAGAVGGMLIIFIAFQLLNIRRISISNFLPAIPLMFVCSWMDPWIQKLYSQISA